MSRVHALTAVCIALASLLIGTTMASAHARYKSSIPGVSEVVATAPSKVQITFTEDVAKESGTYFIRVTNSAGASVTSGATILDDADRTMMSVALQGGLPNGRYRVDWQTKSADDGDTATGAFAFYVGVQPTAVDRAADADLAAVGAEEETPTATTGAAATSPTAGAQPTGAAASASPTRSAVSQVPNTGQGSSDGRRQWVVEAGLLGLGVAVSGIGAVGVGRRRSRS